MTVTEPSKAAVDLVTLTIDGIEVSVPKGTLLIRAAEELGIAIPRFCDHPCWPRPAPAGSAWSRWPCRTGRGTCGRCPSRRPPAR